MKFAIGDIVKCINMNCSAYGKEGRVDRVYEIKGRWYYQCCTDIGFWEFEESDLELVRKGSDEMSDNMKMKPESDMRIQFATGAVRGVDVSANCRYDLITPIGLRALAETYGEGSIKYGDNNWKKGIPRSNLLKHAINHIEAYRLLHELGSAEKYEEIFEKSGIDPDEPHLAHAVWNLMTIIHFDVVGWPDGCE